MIELPQGAPAAIGTAGFEVPDFGGATRTEIGELREWNGTISHLPGEDNAVIANGAHNFQIEFQGGGSHRNRIYLNECGGYHGQISVQGSDNAVIMCGGAWHSNFSVHVSGHGSLCFIGRGATFVNATMFVTGDGVSVVFGEDCMVSHGVMVRTYDQHAMIDLLSGAWVNEPKSVLIGPHVWLGQEVLVLKGATIGAGSIIGARSTVTGDIEARTLAIGAPARAVRSGISWIRGAVPADAAVAAMRALLGRCGE
jgi:acetyltransferase-like isoleucine patch superfamily enzyme